MKLYEYESKQILKKYGVSTPKGELVTTVQEALAVAGKLGFPLAIKAQVLFSGRGKAGGVLFASSALKLEKTVRKLLCAQINEVPVKELLVEKKIAVKRELYFSITIDRFNQCFLAIASSFGGIDVEEISIQQPEQIIRVPINLNLGFGLFKARQVTKKMGYTGDQMVKLSKILKTIFQMCLDFDAELVEVNPLVETLDGNFVALDAHIILDESALFRHKEYQKKRFEENRELGSREFDALREGLEYVKLSGSIGVVGNGAGLVMATVDLINLYGGKPADFLDLGGGASTEKIEKAIKFVLSDSEVSVLFVNILGGITRCDEVASTIVKLSNELFHTKPIVVRLVGTNEAKGKRILGKASIAVFDNMESAAQKAVELSKRLLNGNNT